MEPITIESLVVKSPDSLVRVLLGEHCLDFHPDDVLDLQELPRPDGLIPGSAVLARISLRSGAALMGIASGKAYQPLLWDWPQPFCLATRPTRMACGENDMAEQERAFFRQRGIRVDRLDEPTPASAREARP